MQRFDHRFQRIHEVAAAYLDVGRLLDGPKDPRYFNIPLDGPGLSASPYICRVENLEELLSSFASCGSKFCCTNGYAWHAFFPPGSFVC